MLTQRWLTEKQVSAITGISVSKLQKDRFYRRGIPYSRPMSSRSIRYDIMDVEAHMLSTRVNTEEVENASR